jgi:hypothetical protein
MTKKIILLALCSLLLAPCSAVEAQQPTKIPRIGILSPGSSAFPGRARYDSFRQGLRKLGYIEGKNIFIEIRTAEGKQDRLSDFATELVKLKVDVIVTAGTPGVLAAKNATSAIPIVFWAVADPVRAGLVSSLARPGGNITGLTSFGPELDGKRLELLKETFPKITRVSLSMVLWPLTWSTSRTSFRFFSLSSMMRISSPAILFSQCHRVFVSPCIPFDLLRTCFAALRETSFLALACRGWMRVDRQRAIALALA